MSIPVLLRLERHVKGTSKGRTFAAEVHVRLSRLHCQILLPESPDMLPRVILKKSFWPVRVLRT